jgi:hypothetical protein
MLKGSFHGKAVCMSWALVLYACFRRPLEGNQGIQQTLTCSAEICDTAQTALGSFNDAFSG